MNSSIKLLLGLMAAVPVAHASALILGDTSGNSRGTDAVDIQTARNQASEVASGDMAMVVGLYNAAQGESNIVVGNYNLTYGSSAGDEFSTAFGSTNTVHGFGAAFGFVNEVTNNDLYWEEASMAFGGNNILSGHNAFAFGEYNEVTGDHSMAVGFAVENGTNNSLMIGPSNTAKVTILSTGYVGIGLGASSPSQMLEVGGNIKTSGSVTAASDVEITTSSNGLILKSPNGTRFRITISNAGVLTATSL